MALDPDDIRVFGDGAVYLAPYGTTLPTALNEALNSSFGDLGYLTDDGWTLTLQREMMEISAWQARGPVIVRPKSRIYRVNFMALENDDLTVLAWNDGGTYASSGTGERVYTPPDNASYEEWSVVIDVTDNTYEQRYVLDHCIVTENDGITYKKDDPTKFGMTLTVLGGEDGSAGWRRYESTAAVS